MPVAFSGEHTELCVSHASFRAEVDHIHDFSQPTDLDLNPCHGWLELSSGARDTAHQEGLSQMVTNLAELQVINSLQCALLNQTDPGKRQGQA